MADYLQAINTPPRSFLIKNSNYGNLSNDPMNWTGGAIGSGELVGTACDIGAPIWCQSDYFGGPGECPTMQELASFDCNEAAKEIMKFQFWDVVQGDKIISQEIANIVFHIKAHTGNIKEVQEALNDNGAQLAVDGSMGPATLSELNKQTRRNEARTFNAIRTQYYNFLDSISKPGTSNEIYRNGWLGAVDKYYPLKPETGIAVAKSGVYINGAKYSWILIIPTLILIILLIVIIVKYVKR